VGISSHKPGVFSQRNIDSIIEVSFCGFFNYTKFSWEKQLLAREISFPKGLVFRGRTGRCPKRTFYILGCPFWGIIWNFVLKSGC
jgi:hypothetical protein